MTRNKVKQTLLILGALAASASLIVLSAFATRAPGKTPTDHTNPILLQTGTTAPPAISATEEKPDTTTIVNTRYGFEFDSGDLDVYLGAFAGDNLLSTWKYVVKKKPGSSSLLTLAIHDPKEAIINEELARTWSLSTEQQMRSAYLDLSRQGVSLTEPRRYVTDYGIEGYEFMAYGTTTHIFLTANGLTLSAIWDGHHPQFAKLVQSLRLVE